MMPLPSVFKLVTLLCCLLSSACPISWCAIATAAACLLDITAAGFATATWCSLALGTTTCVLVVDAKAKADKDSVHTCPLHEREAVVEEVHRQEDGEELPARVCAPV